MAEAAMQSAEPAHQKQYGASYTKCQNMQPNPGIEPPTFWLEPTALPPVPIWQMWQVSIYENGLLISK